MDAPFHATPHNCHQCGYDLRGTPGKPCPECGTLPSTNTQATAESVAMSLAAMRLLQCFLAPAGWLVVLNLLYLWARLQTGEWPGPWNNPDPTPFLGYCFRTMSYLIFAVLAAIVVLPGMIWIRHTRVLINLNASARTTARQVSHLIWIWLACLGLCYLALMIDPLGAFEWLAD